MAKGINYGKLTSNAFRQVMVDVLSQVAREGLPGDHHFFITFDTQHPGVDMANSLRQRYPEEMTVVMQDWFEDLAVMKDRFTVTLNFGDIPEPIVIPFDAVKTFVDPSVNFGLKFDPQEGPGGNSGDEPPRGPEKPSGDSSVVSLDKFRKH